MNDEASALHADPARAFDGQYQLGDEIGAGALGVVYRGVDEKLDKSVAIKVWHARLEDETPLREQYDVEARALTALDHPNVVAITDYGIAGQAPYLVMELLDGETLGARMRHGALPASATQTIMQSVLRGLGYMHMRGVMHRNLKPDNVFLHKLDADSEQLKLLDLGLESLPANTNADAVRERRTAYDAPEHDAGTEPDGRSDVYAAGVLMLHMLSGREPTRELVRAAADSADLLEALLSSATPEVRAFIARAIAPERGNRFGNADQMLRALLELSTPWAGDPPGAVAAPAQPQVASIKPQVQPAHAQLEVAATTSPQGETVERPAAESDEEVVLGPIGLMAKLRAHKRLLLLGGGAVGLAAIGGVLALMLSQSATGEHEPEPTATQQPPAKSAKAAPAAHEDEDELEQEESQPILKREEPTPEHATQKYAARLGDGAPEAKPTSEEISEPSAAAASAVQPAVEQTKATAHGAGAPATPAKAAAEAPAQVKALADDNPSAPVVPRAAVEPPAARSGKTEARAAAATASAKAEEPKAPTPEQIGSERHIEPDKSEIRKMLALAIAPKPRVPAKDPWNIEVPGSLQALRDAIAKGERGSAGNLRTLRHYSSENPDDVYGHLLLAGFYANRGFSLDALDQYDMAYRIDTSSRGAPEMLKHALTMVAQGIAEGDAARFIDRVYGREALAAIAQLAKARDTSPAAARRLRQLQARIGPAKRR